MQYGASIWDVSGREIVSQYSPYNFLMEMPVWAGTHSFTVPNVLGTLACGYATGGSSGGSTGYVVTSISINGSTVTYTSTYSAELAGMFINPVIQVFVRR